jgi:hypothetical protein
MRPAQQGILARNIGRLFLKSSQSNAQSLQTSAQTRHEVSASTGKA